MKSELKLAIIDDRGLQDPFYGELLSRLDEAGFATPKVTWFDASRLFSGDQFDPGRIVAQVRRIHPDLILLDLVLREFNGRHDLIVSDWLAKALRRDADLKKVPLLFLSHFLDADYSVTGPWNHWVFCKPRLHAEPGVWHRFEHLLEDLPRLAKEQEQVSSAPRIEPLSR